MPANPLPELFPCRFITSRTSRGGWLQPFSLLARVLPDMLSLRVLQSPENELAILFCVFAFPFISLVSQIFMGASSSRRNGPGNRCRHTGMGEIGHFRASGKSWDSYLLNNSVTFTAGVAYERVLAIYSMERCPHFRFRYREHGRSVSCSCGDA